MASTVYETCNCFAAHNRSFTTNKKPLAPRVYMKGYYRKFNKGLFTIVSVFRYCSTALQSFILNLQIVQLRLIFSDRGFKTTF